MKKIEIGAKVEFNEYLKLVYFRFYKRPIIIIATFIGLFMLLIPSSLYFLGFLHPEGDTNPFITFSIGFAAVVLLPLMLYYTAQKSKKLFQKTIKYIFSKEGVGIVGDTFNATLTWEYILKVEELNNWILIYQSKYIINFIPKNSFSDEKLKQFKELINSLPDLKKKLKP